MLILYTTEDGKSRIQLHADENTVWLTQLEMADLFATTKQNISRHISTAAVEAAVDLTVTHNKLVDLEATLSAAREKHDPFLRELGLPLLPGSGHERSSV